MKDLVAKIKTIYAIAGELTQQTGRPFTPDGHMVGSIGEVFAAHIYGLDLLTPSATVHDAKKGELSVQIKATGGDRVALSSNPKHLIVLKLESGKPEEVFNGPGNLVWKNAGKKQKNGQRQIYLSKLKKLMSQIRGDQMLKKVREVES